MIFLAVFLPGVYFIVTGNVLRGVAALLLQFTLVGWIPVVVWTLLFRQEKIRNNERENADKRMDKLIAAVMENRAGSVSEPPQLEYSTTET
jgi:hypothetical protein